jgi:hypothetical protein
MGYRTYSHDGGAPPSGTQRTGRTGLAKTRRSWWWPVEIPFWNITYSGGTSANYSAAGSTGILGFYAAGGVGDSGNIVTITAAGTQWGLTQTWSSVRAAAASSVDIVLATDNAGYAAAWVKHYLPNDTFRGFVRIYDISGQPDVEDIIGVAEYREPSPTLRCSAP